MPKFSLVEINRHVEMMQDPDRWPQWPYLPLKRTFEGMPGYQTGYLIDKDGGGPIIHIGNIFTASPSDTRVEYSSYTSMVQAGWQVD